VINYFIEISDICRFLRYFTQKFDNYNYIEKASKKTSFLILIPFLIIILITGLAIKAGSSEKFIYFDF